MGEHGGYTLDDAMLRETDDMDLETNDRTNGGSMEALIDAPKGFPGSKQAVKAGCKCGQDSWQGLLLDDPRGRPALVSYNVNPDCPIHGENRPIQMELIWRKK